MKIFLFIQKTKGAISIFMAIIILAMMAMTSVLVEGSRIRSAEAILQSASDSAIRSVTAKYDKKLKDSYGLFALEETDQQAIQDDYLRFLSANLSAELPGGQDSFSQYFDQIMEYVYEESDSHILDLYNFKIEEANVNTVYSVIEPNVLQKQMVEYSKYRSAFVLGDLFNIGDSTTAAMGTATIDTGNLKKTLNSRKSVESVMTAVYNWTDELEKQKNFLDSSKKSWLYTIKEIQGIHLDINDILTEMAEAYASLEDAAEDEDVSEYENEILDLEEELKEHLSDSTAAKVILKYKNIAPIIKDLNELKTALKEKQALVSAFFKDIDYAIAEAENSKGNLDNNGTKEVTEGLKTDANDMVKELQKLKEVVNKNKQWLDTTLEWLDTIEPLLLDLEKEEYSYLTIIQSESDAISSKKLIQAIQKDITKILNLFAKDTGTIHKYKYQMTEEMNSKADNLWNFYGSLKSKDIKSQGAINNPAKIEGDVKTNLPSNKYKNDENNDYHTNDKYADQDKAFIELQKQLGITSDSTSDIALGKIDAKNAENSINIIQQFMEMMSGMATDATNAVITDMYTMSMFKARTSKTTKQWAEIYGKSNTAAIASSTTKPHDRKRDTEEDKNLRLVEKASLKKGDKTFFDAEIEYIAVGNPNESENADLVYLQIFGMRMGINTIAVLSDKDLTSLSTAASAIAGPFAPVVKVGILLILALVETCLDMYFLIDMGYKIPLLKNGCLTIGVDNLENMCKNLASSENGANAFRSFTPNNKSSSIMTDYETYLYFLLLLVNRETKLLRMADIIQLNMQVMEKDTSYQLAEHYTAVRAHTTTSIKPMMMGYGFLPPDMRKDGRYKLETLIYEGY